MKYTTKEPEDMNIGWRGVDLDGTLAYYDGWRGIDHIGDPIEPMVSRVKQWLGEGKRIKIFTARVSVDDDLREEVIQHIDAWCEKHIGQKLEITNQKDFAMIELWDDRCVEVKFNEGIPIAYLEYESGYYDARECREFQGPDRLYIFTDPEYERYMQKCINDLE